MSAWSKILLFSPILLAFSVSYGQEDEKGEIESFIQIRWDNDFVYGTDHYRSNMLFFSIESGFMDHSPLNHILLPYPDIANVWHGLNSSHEFYTPVDIYSEEIQYGDRPYAAVLLFSNSRYAEHTVNTYVIRSSIQMGVMGPLAGGEQMQNSIHRILWTSSPAKGWDKQVQNEFCLMYSAGIEKSIFELGYLLFEAEVDVQLGIPYTHLKPGFEIRLGKYNDPYRTKGFCRSGWQLYAQAFIWTDLVLYNGTIQGGVLNTSSPYTTDIENFVPGFNAGLFVSFRQFRLGMLHIRLAPEFVGGMYHNYNSFSFDFAF
jgi:hypothetical protein